MTTKAIYRFELFEDDEGRTIANSLSFSGLHMCNRNKAALLESIQSVAPQILINRNVFVATFDPHGTETAPNPDAPEKINRRIACYVAELV